MYSQKNVKRKSNQHSLELDISDIERKQNVDKRPIKRLCNEPAHKKSKIRSCQTSISSTLKETDKNLKLEHEQEITPQNFPGISWPN